ncbi:hypothetical protein TrLO_g1808 [Triparma laevis f. longispina]|uniref:Uncharacterized protein n=1 Tax=Triparma laevis f. longispina TaxID=1714387 RepID=A0A9W7ADY1_9STRA|nr:hypothetical protein TrLO_g1808 [Triparma laevis f. longispina]
MTRSQPCPICRKPISSFEVGVYSGSLGERRLWLTSARNIRELAKNDAFNEYFQKQFNGNEATFLRWKEVRNCFDVLEIEGGKGIYYTVRESNEQQVLRITRSEDLVKLRALAKLCSREFFDDPSLLVVAWRRFLRFWSWRCRRRRKAIQEARDFEEAGLYMKRAKEGYEEQLGRDNEKALEATYSLIACTAMTMDEKFEKMRNFLKMMERALGESDEVTLNTLNELGCVLQRNEEYEETKEV